MKTRWHKRYRSVLIVLAVLAVAAVPTGYFVGREVLKGRIMSWRDEGLAAASAGDHERAAEVLGRYLKRRPGDSVAVRAFVKSREIAELPHGMHLYEAANALKSLLAEDPGNLEDRRHLLHLYVKLDKRPEALDTAEAILRRSADARTMEYKADVLRRMGREREALAVAQDWARVAPGDVTPHITRLTLRSRLGHPRESIVADARALREARPGDATFELLQGVAYGVVGDTAQAAEWLRSAARHDQLPDVVAKALVAQFDALGMSEDSLAVLKRLVERGGGTELRHALARRQWEMRLWDQVVHTLAPLECADPASDPTLAAFKAMSLARSGNAAGAKACRDPLASRKQAVARAWTLLLSRELDGYRPDDRAIVAECRAALLLEPDNTYLGYYLGEAYSRLGEPDLAAQAWRITWERNPAWNAPAVQLVDTLLRKGQPEEALRVATTAARRDSTNAACVIALARAWAAGVEQGRTAQIDDLSKLVEEVQRQLPGETQTLMVQVGLLARRGSTADAVRVIRTAAARTPPPDEQALISLAGLSRRHGLGVEAECLDRSEQAHGLTPSLAYARAVDRLLTDGADAGAAAFEQSAARAGGKDPARWQLARARYLDVAGLPGARGAWVALADAHPDDLAVQQGAASARSVRGEWDFMERTIDRLKKLSGEGGLAWRMARARLMIEAPRNDADYAQGSVLLSEITREHPHLPEPHVLLARALVQMKRIDGAVDHLSTAARLDPTSVPIALQLASLLQSRGEFERVRQELDRAVPYLQSARQRQQAALLLAQQGSQDLALQLLEEQKGGDGASGTASLQEDLMLATLYRRKGDFSKAEAVVGRLLDREPPELGAVEFGAFLYASQSRRADAERVLKRLDQMRLAPGIKDLVWGSYSAQVGDLAAAERHYTAASTQWPDNPGVWRALAATLVAAGKPDQAVAALERGATALPSDKSLTAIKAHIDLVRATAADPVARPFILEFFSNPLQGDAPVELLRTLSEERRSGEMERFVARLQKIIDAHPNYLPARVQLVQTQVNMRRLPDALATAQRAMKDFPTAPLPAQVAVQVALASSNWQDAQAAAANWKQRSPVDSVSADVAAARALIGMRRYAQALGELEPHLSAAKSDPDRQSEFVTAYATALVHAGRTAEADKLLWPLADKTPGWRLHWLRVALEVPDGATATQWLDRLAAVTNPAEIDQNLALAEAYDKLGDRVNSPQLREKSKAMFRQLAERPEVTGVVLQAAGAQAERTNDRPAAEAYYRRAIALDATLVIAHNNLANLLAVKGGDVAEATRLQSAALALQPRAATLYDTMAFIRSTAGDAAGAASNMRTAVALEPDIAKWRVRLAQYLLDAGQTAEAAKAVAAIDDRRLDLQALPPNVRRQLDTVRRQVRPARSTSADVNQGAAFLTPVLGG